MMKYFIVKDGQIEASCATHENALALIRAYQQRETHYILKAEFSIIKGEEEPIPYKFR